jgi:hypothetical protein
MVRPFRRGWGHDSRERAVRKKRPDEADARRSPTRRRERFGRAAEQLRFGTSAAKARRVGPDPPVTKNADDIDAALDDTPIPGAQLNADCQR